jgi:hypothetical protein
MVSWKVLAPLVLVAAAIGIFALTRTPAAGEYIVQRTAGSQHDRIFVDPGGVGGHCEDDRSADRASDPRTPLCSLSMALSLARSGTRIELRGGRYPALKVANPIATVGSVTIAPYRSEQVSVASVALSHGASRLRLERLRVPGGIKLQGAQDPADAVHHVSIVNCVISSRGNDAVLIEWGSHDVVVERNRITSAGDGITLNSVSDAPGAPPHTPQEVLPPISRVIIRGNRLDDIGTDAIRPANFDDLLVEGNDITGVDESGDHSDALQVVWGGRNLRVLNNVIHDIRGQGLFIKDGLVTDVVIEGNRLLRGRSGPQIALYETDGLRLRNNIVRDAQYGVTLGAAVRDAVVEHNVFSDFTVDGDPARLAAQMREDHNVLGPSWNWADQGRAGPNDKRLSKR